MEKEVAGAAAQCDFLIVYFHWGTEFTSDVSDAQIEIAHTAADSGASAVVGAHPHVLQGKETYNGVPIYYSLGNFVFDAQEQEGTDKALIVQFTVDKTGLISIDELPVVINDCQPCLAAGQTASHIIADFVQYSGQFVQ